MKYFIKVFFLLIIFGAQTGMSQSQDPFPYASAFTLQKTLVLEAPVGKKIKFVDVSHDGKRWAYIIQDGDDDQVEVEQSVFVDGKKVGQYKNVQGFMFSPDGLHYYFLTTRHIPYTEKLRGGGIGYGSKQKTTLHVDGKEYGTYSQVYGPKFSSDGRHVVFHVTEDEKSFVILDGKEGRKYRFIDPVMGLQFSPQTSQLFYIGQNGTWSKKVSYLVVNQKEFKPYDWITQFRFSPHSDNYFYLAQKGGKEFLVINGVEQSKHDRVFVWGRGDGSPLQVVCDGSGCPKMEALTIYDFLNHAGESSYVCEPTKVAAFDPGLNAHYAVIDGSIIVGDLEALIALTPLEKSWVAIARKDGHYQLTTPDKQVPISLDAGDLPIRLISNLDVTEFAIQVKRPDGQEYILHRDHKTPAYPAICRASLSADGNHLAYVGTRWVQNSLQKFMVQDGVVGSIQRKAGHKSSFKTRPSIAKDVSMKWVVWPLWAWRNPNLVAKPKHFSLQTRCERVKKASNIPVCAETRYRYVDDQGVSQEFDVLMTMKWNEDQGKIGFLVRDGNQLWWIVGRYNGQTKH